MVIESLERRAMLAGVGAESWSAQGLAPAPLGTGALLSSGVILTCSRPAPGSSGTASPPAPAAGSGTTSGGDLWDSYSAGSGAGGSKSGSTGGVSTNGPALLSRYTGGSGIGRITPLVYNPESDGPPVFHSGVWTGDDGSVQFVQTADTENQGTGAGDALQSEGEPKPRTLWQWFWGDDPIKGSLWKQGPSRISRAGDRPTHNDDKSAVESLEDGGKLAKEVIDGAKRDGALAGAGAVIGKLGAQNNVTLSASKNFNQQSHGGRAKQFLEELMGAKIPEKLKTPEGTAAILRGWEEQIRNGTLKCKG